MIIRSFPYGKETEAFWVNNLLPYLETHVGKFISYQSHSQVTMPVSSDMYEKWHAYADDFLARTGIKTHKNNLCMIAEFIGDGWRLYRADDMIFALGANTRRHIVIEFDDPDDELLMRLTL
jgi:hypothetical protein